MLQDISAPRGYVKNIDVLAQTYIQCLHLMHSEVAWVLVPSGTHVLSQIILDPDYLSDYRSISYDYDYNNLASLFKQKK